MPRLRYMKDYSPIQFEQTGEHNDVQTQDQTEPDDGASGVDGVDRDEQREQRSWWSNENIVASMPDAALRSALHRYRELVRLCQDELVRRQTHGITVRAEPSFDLMGGRLRYVGRETVRHSVPRSARVRNNRGTNQTLLTPEQMLQALQMLHKLKQLKSTPRGPNE